MKKLIPETIENKIIINFTMWVKEALNTYLLKMAELNLLQAFH